MISKLVKTGLFAYSIVQIFVSGLYLLNYSFTREAISILEFIACLWVGIIIYEAINNEIRKEASGIRKELVRAPLILLWVLLAYVGWQVGLDYAIWVIPIFVNFWVGMMTYLTLNFFSLTDYAKKQRAFRRATKATAGSGLQIFFIANLLYSNLLVLLPEINFNIIAIDIYSFFGEDAVTAVSILTGGIFYALAVFKGGRHILMERLRGMNFFIKLILVAVTIVFIAISLVVTLLVVFFTVDVQTISPDLAAATLFGWSMGFIAGYIAVLVGSHSSQTSATESVLSGE